MVERMVIIGGDAAGMSAGSQARRMRGPDDLAIVVFERGTHTSYSACGIPYWIAGMVSGPSALVARDPETYRREYAMDVRLRHEVIAIDLDRREVVARALDDGGREVREPFDTLVYAAGAIPQPPPWPERDVAGVFGVQTLNDGEALRAWLSSHHHMRRAVVLGGGYIGVTMAEALVRRGLAVTLIDRAEQPMPTMDPDMGRMVSDALKEIGIDVRSGVVATGLEHEDGRVTAVHTNDGTMPADVVILGLGVRPNTQLAAEAGFPIGVTGGIKTDDHMRVVGEPGQDDSRFAGVWAAGDCVETVHRITGQPVHLPLGTHANKQGRVAGLNIGGSDATFPGVIGTTVSKVCGLEVARTGLRERDAQQAGLPYLTVTVTSTNRAPYFPGTASITVKLIAERPSGRLLGAQIIGESEAAKRIDPLAVAIWNDMTVVEMTSLDLGYAPPYAPVWDPVLVAARKAANAIDGDKR